MGVPRGLHLVGGMAWLETPVAHGVSRRWPQGKEQGHGDQGQPMATRKAKLSQQQEAGMCFRHRVPSEKQTRTRRPPSPESHPISCSSFSPITIMKACQTHRNFVLFQGHPLMIPLGEADYKK